MKIAVIGSPATVDAIQFIMKDYKVDFSLEYHVVHQFEESARCAMDLQEKGAVQAILFTGPTNYNYTRNIVNPQVPWSFIPHTKSSIYQAIAEASIKYGSDADFVSVDSYEPELIYSAFTGLGKENIKILRPNRHYSEANFEEGLLEFHRSNYKKNPSTICFTNMEHIQEPLLSEGIPCVRFKPSDESIREQLADLRLQYLSSRESKGMFAVIALRYTFRFDEESDLSLREWEKMEYMNSVRRQCYETALRINGAVFQQGIDAFFLVTSREMLFQGFIKGGEYMNLISFASQAPGFDMRIAMGTGHNMMEAYSRCTMSLNTAMEANSGKIFFADNEKPEILELGDVSKVKPAAIILEMSRKSGVRTETMHRIREIQEACGGQVTSSILSQQLGINVRSANRIIAKLENAGYITLTGKNTKGKGRPQRILRISFPEGPLEPGTKKEGR